MKLFGSSKKMNNSSKRNMDSSLRNSTSSTNSSTRREYTVEEQQVIMAAITDATYLDSNRADKYWNNVKKQGKGEVEQKGVYMDADAAAEYWRTLMAGCQDEDEDSS
ncbi:expressed unknown protein [Seminavis robusta]|uniref:Uncharacterized protein n=1 Tax=Seminavis robusta TaxID=568900 RepID=A0A9N8EAM2_9STRA|nr:expressed unknown protein [Seminavis robusta]|eukprot:Sro681_g186420.1 n/a (107) ;mRNA; r:48407-48727